MRRKFFVVVFVFLLISITIVSALELLFFASERMRLVDQRLETIASTLIASGLSLSFIENLDSTDDLVHDLLGEERVDQIINIYGLDGQLLAQNFTGAEIPLMFNAGERWQNVSVKGREVRVLNFASGRIVIQIGMVLDPSLLNRFNAFSSRLFVFMFLILCLLAIVAYYSSGVLFRPLRDLTRELRSMSEQLDHQLGQPLSRFVVGNQLKQLSLGIGKSKDEFELLSVEIILFLKKLEEYTRSFNAQAAILTHELKTPLTILKNYLSELRTEIPVHSQLGNELFKKALLEIDQLTKVINDYLQWSVLSSNPSQPTEIYALKLEEIIQKIVTDLNQLHDDRIIFSSTGELRVFALPDHVRQLILNLLSNALSYSQGSVKCAIIKDCLVVEDQGPGIPEFVQERIGSPFNRGNIVATNSPSSGLGLAWVNSLCNKYHWDLSIDSSSHGTRVSVRFEAL